MLPRPVKFKGNNFPEFTASQYPGFTLQEFYQAPIPVVTPQVAEVDYPKGQVEFVFNSDGYRCQEFSTLDSNYILIAGASLTEGAGLHQHETWPVKLAQNLNCDFANLGKIGANAQFVSRNVINWLQQRSRPRAVVIQWPDAFRSIHWQDQVGVFATSSIPDSLFKAKLLASNNNFWQPWLDSVLAVDQLCKHMSLLCVHLCFEPPELLAPVADILHKHDVTFHMDQKQPGATWHVDRGARDGSHHSEWCNEQWAERLQALLK
jgi:hypothetical protein